MRTIIISSLLLLASCGSQGDLSTEIIGKWKLSSYEEGDENPFKKNMGEFEISDCDKASVWNFLNEGAESLSDGTEVKTLIVDSGKDCEFYEFESKWTVKGKNLFLTSTSLGGIGGRSYAGLFEVLEFNKDQMIIEISDAKFTFERLE